MSARKGLNNFLKLSSPRDPYKATHADLQSSLDEHNRQTVNAFYGDNFQYMTLEGAWESFQHLGENSHLHATSLHFGLNKQLQSKGAIYDV